MYLRELYFINCHLHHLHGFISDVPTCQLIIITAPSTSISTPLLSPCPMHTRFIRTPKPAKTNVVQTFIASLKKEPPEKQDRRAWWKKTINWREKRTPQHPYTWLFISLELTLYSESRPPSQSQLDDTPLPTYPQRFLYSPLPRWIDADKARFECDNSHPSKLSLPVSARRNISKKTKHHTKGYNRATCGGGLRV